MALRRKLKRAEITLGKTIEVHERMAIDAPEQLRVAPVDVQDPYNPEETIRVVRSTRDTLTWMYSRGAVDEPQRLAGERWRKCWHRCQFGIGSIDTTKEAVDGGKIYEPIPDFRALEFLSRCRMALGWKGDFIIHRLLADNLFPREIALIFGETGDRAVRNYTWAARDHLETIARLDTNPRMFTVRS